jgi:hypothetical protein
MAALIMLVQFVATLTTITLFLAGLPTARKIATVGDTAQFSVVPWLAQVRCMQPLLRRPHMLDVSSHDCWPANGARCWPLLVCWQSVLKNETVMPRHRPQRAIVGQASVQHLSTSLL